MEADVDDIRLAVFTLPAGMTIDPSTVSYAGRPPLHKNMIRASLSTLPIGVAAPPRRRLPSSFPPLAGLPTPFVDLTVPNVDQPACHLTAKS